MDRSKAWHVPYLGGIPLDPRGQARADTGVPLVVGDPEGPVGAAFTHLAGEVLAAVERERHTREREQDELQRNRQQAFWERLVEDD